MAPSKTRVRLSLQCDNLVDKDLLSKSDPVVIVDMMDIKQSVFKRIGMTERIKNNLNPKFDKTIEVEYVFEKKQFLRFLVLDCDGDEIPTEYTPKMNDGDLLGRAEVTMAEIMGARNCTVSKKLCAQIQNKDYGSITIRGLKLEDDVRDDDLLVFKLSGVNLAAKDHYTFSTSSSDPFFKIYRKEPQEKEMCQSEVVDQNLNPVWKEQAINLKELCGGDLQKKIKIHLWDKDMMSEDDTIGLTDFKVEDLLTKVPIQLNDYKGRPLSELNPGAVQTIEATTYRTPNFADYSAKGLDVNLVFAIDFTKSNGEISDTSSLHYRGSTEGQGLDASEVSMGLKVTRGPNWNWGDQDGGAGKTGEIVGPVEDGWVRVNWLGNNVSNTYRCGADGLYDLMKLQLNPYQKAMTEISKVLMDFDADKKIEAYGFGGVLPDSPDGRVSWCHPLNFTNPIVDGVEGLLSAYSDALNKITLGDEGTYMETLVKHINARAEATSKEPGSQEYHVLVILTDGDVSDYTATGDAIVAASELPVSIIVAGMKGPGHDSEDFGKWSEIDQGALTLKDQNGKKLERDTVNFVMMDEPTELTERVLSEFSDQLVAYFEGKNISPKFWSEAPQSVFNYKILSKR